MKAPDFWYRPAGIEARLLAPLGQVYRAAGLLRRAGTTPYRAKIPLICVGNIVAGGAGKTPAAMALAELLKRQGGKPVFVSRGYGGSEPGPLFVDPGRHTAREVGDEALLLAGKAPCWIGRNRAAAVMAAEPHATHIILDDGLQNPSVDPSFSLLVIDGETGLGNGMLIPAGPLRETLADALKRVDAVVMIGEDKQYLASVINKPVLRAALQHRLPDGFPSDHDFFAFAGIGRPEKFYASCRAAGLNIVSTLDFPDHYMFSAKELADMADHTRMRYLTLITTAKDAARLPPAFREEVVVLPVELVFEDEAGMLRILQTKADNQPQVYTN
jgi:tetraacyldisaccharide 4'-kinase